MSFCFHLLLCGSGTGEGHPLDTVQKLLDTFVRKADMSLKKTKAALSASSIELPNKALGPMIAMSITLRQACRLDKLYQRVPRS